jgi:5-methylcytosine-specific restriction endonuclease McrA
MKKWPDNYQERIETIIGAKYDETNYVFFLGFNFETIRDANDCIDQIRLMQKQLRQVKMELGNKIRVAKSQRPHRARKKDGAVMVLASLVSDLGSSHKIRDYQYVVLNLNNLLDACEKRKIQIEMWIGQNKLNIRNESSVRLPIPEEVQIFVWNRDGGRCVKCGNQENLEFDHIIPISKGGSNTARNIQLLCETHNREKSNSIGG